MTTRSPLPTVASRIGGAAAVFALGLTAAFTGCGSGDGAETANAAPATRTTALAWVLGGVGVDGKSLVLYPKTSYSAGGCDKPVRARVTAESVTGVRVVVERVEDEQTGNCSAIGRIKFTPLTVQLRSAIAGRSIAGPREATAFPRQLLTFGDRERPTVTVPRVVGLTTEDAKRALCTAALASAVPSRPLKVVTSQTPAGGTKVRKQSSVSVDDARTPCADLSLSKRVRLKVR